MAKRRMIRVAIVDDRSAVRAGIRGLLRAAKDIQVIGEAANGEEALELARTQNPDIMLLDVELPVLRGDPARVSIPPATPPAELFRRAGD